MLRVKIKDLYQNPFLKREFEDKEKIFNEVIDNTSKLNQTSIIAGLRPSFLNELPNIENKMFLERLKDIDVSKADIFGLSKKIPLESPEWKFENEE